MKSNETTRENKGKESEVKVTYDIHVYAYAIQMTDIKPGNNEQKSPLAVWNIIKEPQSEGRQ